MALDGGSGEEDLVCEFQRAKAIKTDGQQIKYSHVPGTSALLHGPYHRRVEPTCDVEKRLQRTMPIVRNTKVASEAICLQPGRLLASHDLDQ